MLCQWDEQMKAASGDLFKKDNGIVYDERKALLVNSPAYTWIQPFDHNRNEQQAWLALISHYEGTNEQNHIKDVSYGQHGCFYSDTMFVHLKLFNSNTCGQIFISNVVFYHFTSLQNESEANNAQD